MAFVPLLPPVEVPSVQAESAIPAAPAVAAVAFSSRACFTGNKHGSPQSKRRWRLFPCITTSRLNQRRKTQQTASPLRNRAHIISIIVADS